MYTISQTPTESVETYTNLNLPDDMRVRVQEFVCPCCGSMVLGFTQPGLLPGRPARSYLNCVTATCAGATTLEVENWFALVMPFVDMRADADAVHAGVSEGTAA